MRQAIGAIIILTCLTILIHDGVSWRMTVFRKVYNRSDLNGLPHKAADRRNWAEVIRLVRMGADVNTKHPYGSTLLHRAALFGHREAAAVLIARGARVDARDRDGRTALHLAALCSHGTVVELLIKNGADVNARDRGGATPLYSTVGAGVGRRRIAEVLIASGAEVDSRAKDGSTPLFRATMCGNRALAEFLIAKGAKVNATNHHAYTALDCVANDEVAACLRKHGAKAGWQLVSEVWAELQKAAASGSKDFARALIGISDAVRARTDWGDTLLHIAVGNGHEDIAKFLIDTGANVNAKNTSCETPLHLAVWPESQRHWRVHRHPRAYGELLELLLRMGADVNARENRGMTPLDLIREPLKNRESSEALGIRKERERIILRHGGKTGKELEQETANETSHRRSH